MEVFILLSVICLIFAFCSFCDDQKEFMCVCLVVGIIFAIVATCVYTDKSPEPKSETLEERVTRLENELDFVEKTPRFIKMCEEYRFLADIKYDYTCEEYVGFRKNGNDNYASFSQIKGVLEIMRTVKRLPVKRSVK